MNCQTCGTVNREGARFCDNCGTPLASQAPAAQADTVRWGIFIPWCGAWSIKGWFGSSPEDVLAALNAKGDWYRGDNPELGETFKDLYLARVNDERNGETEDDTDLGIAEWHKVVWTDADGGQWIKGDALPLPDGGKIVMTSLE